MKSQYDKENDTKKAWENVIKPHWKMQGSFNDPQEGWKQYAKVLDLDIGWLGYLMGIDHDLTILDSMNCFNSFLAVIEDRDYDKVYDPSLDVMKSAYRPKRDFETGWLKDA
jgi:hypothetical protein